MDDRSPPGAGWPPPIAPDEAPARSWPFSRRDAMYGIDAAARMRLASPGGWVVAWPALILASGFMAGFVYAIGLMIVAGYAAVGEAEKSLPDWQPWLMALIAAAYLFVLWSFLGWSRSRGFAAAVFAWRPRRLLGETAIALLFLGVAIYFGAQANLAVREILPPPSTGPLVGPATPPLSLLMAIPAIVLFGPLVEEVVFRGWMQPALAASGLRIWAAVVVAAAVFGLMHAFDGAGAVAYTFILGLSAGAVRAITGRMWGPILLHAANNALVTIAARLMAGAG